MKSPCFSLLTLASVAGLMIPTAHAQFGGFLSDFPISFNHTTPTGTAPAITTQPASQSAATGANVTFSVVATGTPAPTYQWSLNGRSIKGATSATYTIPSVATSNAGTYSVSVQNDVGFAQSNPVTLSVANAGVVKTAPASVTPNAGATLSLSITTVGTGLTYQWEFQGQPITGATTATYSVPNVGSLYSGTYQVNVSSGTTVVAAELATVSVVTSARLTNLSILGQVGASGQNLVVGFETNGTANKEILVRAVGPTLAKSPYNVTGTLATPELTLYGQNGKSITTNSAWSSTLSSVFTAVGAFPLLTSADAAIEQSLASGGYTATVTGLTGATGVALAEIYDADTGTPASNITNVSGRTYVAANGSVVAGFVIAGTTSDTVLIRGVGPTLGWSFGIGNALKTTAISLYSSGAATEAQVAKNSGWANDPLVTTAATQVGAFPLMQDSWDSALVVTLAPGAYTAVLTGTNSSAGSGMVEIYEVK